MAPRSNDRNQEIRKQSRRQIKDSAFELFARYGYSDTSVSGIARRAGVSKGLIYHYFSSKEEILQAIFDDLTEWGDQAMDFPENLSSRERIERMLNMIFGYIRESSEVVRLMISLALQPDAVAKLESSIREYNERQVNILTTLLSDLGYEDPETEAYYLAAKLDGMTLGYITLGEDYPFDNIKRKILNEYVS